MVYQPRKNHLLRRARLARRSPSGSGRPMSRQELAEAVNALIYATTGRRVALDGNYIGKLERGRYRWPYAHHRAGLRAVLGAERDADLGLYITRRDTDDPSWDEPDVLERTAEDAALAEVSGEPTALPEVLAESAVQLNVSAGAAVTVVYHDGAPGRVAVLAGAVRVLIDSSGTDPATLAPAEVDAPMVTGGARVYSLAERRAR